MKFFYAINAEVNLLAARLDLAIVNVRMAVVNAQIRFWESV